MKLHWRELEGIAGFIIAQHNNNNIRSANYSVGSRQSKLQKLVQKVVKQSEKKGVK